MLTLNILTLTRVYIKGSKDWYTGKVIAYGGYFYFASNAAANFLEREIGIKRGVSGGYHISWVYSVSTSNTFTMVANMTIIGCKSAIFLVTLNFCPYQCA